MIESVSSMASGRTSAISLIFCVLYGTSVRWPFKVKDIGITVFDLQELDLVIAHLQAKLLNPDLDGIPARQTRREVHVSAHAKVRRVDDLVGARHIENGLGVDTGLVSEGAEAGDGVVEGDVDLDGLGDHVLDLLELVELVARGDVVVVFDDHAGEKAAEGLRVSVRGVDELAVGFS